MYSEYMVQLWLNHIYSCLSLQLIAPPPSSSLHCNHSEADTARMCKLDRRSSIYASCKAVQLQPASTQNCNWPIRRMSFRRKPSYLIEIYSIQVSKLTLIVFHRSLVNGTTELIFYGRFIINRFIRIAIFDESAFDETSVNSCNCIANSWPAVDVGACRPAQVRTAKKTAHRCI